MSDSKRSTRLGRMALLITVFVTGCCVLVVEIAATRILAPYFGNTIYTVSSVIGTCLAALSLGYYRGGVLADRSPSLHFFFRSILLGGVTVAFTQLLNVTLLPELGYNFSLAWGSLILSVLLFFIPFYLLGLLSPYAIKLYTLNFPERGTGTAAGEIFFASTCGSILGSVATGFFLIPYFGISSIMLGVSAVLVALGIAGCVYAKAAPSALLPGVSAIICIVLAYLGSTVLPEGIVYAKDGEYEQLRVREVVEKERKVRLLLQDRSASGGMYVDTKELFLPYTKYYTLYQLFKPRLSRAVAIGGGTYSVPAALIAEQPDLILDVVEIEPFLSELASTYFALEPNARLREHITDGRRFLHETSELFDFIYSDVYYSLYSIPSHFVTKEFFELARSKLSPGGVFIGNFIGDLSRRFPSLIHPVIRTFQQAFPNSYIVAVESAHSLNTQNIILIGTTSEERLDLESTLISANSIEPIRTLKDHLVSIDTLNLERYPQLTDNFAPTERLVTRSLLNSFAPKTGDSNGQAAFNAEEALALIETQLSFGPRHLTSAGHTKIQKFLEAELTTHADQVITQAWTEAMSSGVNVQLKNFVGKFNPEAARRVILATHYDTKKLSLNSAHSVPGANDGASGTAVLLELARALAEAKVKPQIGVDIVLFDGEEGDEKVAHEYTNWHPFGSEYFAKNLRSVYGSAKNPEMGIVLDMVCDRDLQIYKEENSFELAKTEVENFWGIATKVSPSFRPTAKWRIGDDHIPLIKAGIPSLLLIDFDYPYFHTTNDTLDKCSVESLGSVGRALVKYIYSDGLKQ